MRFAKNPSSQTLERRIHHSPFANQHPQQPVSGIGGCYRRKILMKATANFTSKADVKISEVIIRQIRENGAVSTRKEIAKEAGYSAPQVTQRMAVIEKKVAEQFRQEGFDMGA